MLFKDQKREKQELKAKPGIWDLAKEIAGTIDPNHKVAWISKSGTTNLNITQLI